MAYMGILLFAILWMVIVGVGLIGFAVAVLAAIALWGLGIYFVAKKNRKGPIFMTIAGVLTALIGHCVLLVCVFGGLE